MWSYKGIEHNNDFLQHRKYRKNDNVDNADGKKNNEETKVQEEVANNQKTKQVQSGLSFVKQYLSNQKKKRK